MIYKKLDNSSVSVHIENKDNSDPYTAIGNKAFLSCKDVYEIKLPDTICKIGDWAFAHMKELKKIIVPSNEISIGRDAFLDCNNLVEIVIYPDDSKNKGLPYLLASCITYLNVYDLLDFKMAAVSNEKWCEKYDTELLRFISLPDDNGFQPFIVGWFNDEGEEEQLNNYIEKKKLDKLKLCFLRLKYNTCLGQETSNQLISYIKTQLECTDADCSGWKLFRDELSDDIQYVKTAVENNIIDAELKLEIIKAINKRNGNPEISAYLLSLEEERESIEQQFKL
ncbi:MAG: leucine-rich repeat protein [Lachnospiraceae bacterium]|nr:leucine-rich repeat protein [Lachnospiraceae bacterium]